MRLIRFFEIWTIYFLDPEFIISFAGYTRNGSLFNEKLKYAANAVL